MKNLDLLLTEIRVKRLCAYGCKCSTCRPKLALCTADQVRRGIWLDRNGEALDK